ncbi:MAG: sulfotransferase family protein [Isosphaeraceae bacterium]
MSWREAFVTTLGPGYFSGSTPSIWLRVLRDNKFAVDPPYWPRALAITLGSFQNALLAGWEDLVYGRRVREATVYPPLFVLGIFRSGTTLLHNLLAQDDRFAYPNVYQACYPKTFLTTESTSARVMEFFLPDRRPQDGIALGMRETAEEEFALCGLTSRNFVMGWVFPRRAEQYERYLTFREATAAEVAEWKSALVGFVRKLSFKYKRPLILKSPANTARIRLLLELFPDARFVHIHRNPYDVFQSVRHTYDRVAPWVTLQRSGYDGLDDRILRQNREAFEVFFEERSLIPQGRFHEVSFAALEADPIGQVRGIYEGLGLPDFGYVEQGLRRYVESLAGYKKNKFPELSAQERSRIAREWRRCFDEWGYTPGSEQ